MLEESFTLFCLHMFLFRFGGFGFVFYATAFDM